MQKIKINETQIAYVDRGAGHVVLLVHGFPLDHSMWNAQIEAFAEQYRVIAVDLRGFGQSPVVGGTTDMQLMADDLAVLLDRLKIKKPITLAGLSMGGYVAFQFAFKYPDRLRALILCDTRAMGDTPEAAAARRRTAEQVMAEGPQALVDSMMPRLFAESTVEQRPDIVAALRGVMLATERQTVSAVSLGMARRPDVRPRLGEIDCPTLVIVGEHDAISPVDEMRDIAECIPRARFVVIVDSGHMTPMEKPDAFNAVVLKFLADLDAGDW